MQRVVSSYLHSHHHGAESVLLPLHCGSRYCDELSPAVCIKKHLNVLLISTSQTVIAVANTSLFQLPSPYQPWKW
jgi:hypothetical protein